MAKTPCFRDPQLGTKIPHPAWQWRGGQNETKLTKLKEEIEKIHNFSWGVQHNTDRTTGQEISKDIEELEEHHQSTRSNR